MREGFPKAGSRRQSFALCFGPSQTGELADDSHKRKPSLRYGDLVAGLLLCSCPCANRNRVARLSEASPVEFRVSLDWRGVGSFFHQGKNQKRRLSVSPKTMTSGTATVEVASISIRASASASKKLWKSAPFCFRKNFARPYPLSDWLD